MNKLAEVHELRRKIAKQVLLKQAQTADDIAMGLAAGGALGTANGFSLGLTGAVPALAWGKPALAKKLLKYLTLTGLGVGSTLGAIDGAR
jgi:hypothetical protein